jgi:xylulokinase
VLRSKAVFGFRHHVEVFAERGLTVRRIFVADGGAASNLWLQITAYVLQRPVTRIDRHPGSSLDAAFVAGIGAGLLRDWSDVRLYVAAGRQFQPDASAISIADQKYEIWREIYNRLQTMFLRLSTIQQVRRGTV